MSFKNNQKLSTFNILDFQKISIPFLALLIGVFLLPKITYASQITPDKIIELTNIEREKNHLEKLKTNRILEQAALNKAKSLMQAQKFTHNLNNKKFSSWVQEVGYDYIYVGENLALDFETAEGTMNAWMNSPSHKENILNTHFTEIGVASIKGVFDGKETILTVEIFGKPISKYAVLKTANPEEFDYNEINKNTKFYILRSKINKNQQNPLFYINFLIFFLSTYIFLQIYNKEYNFKKQKI